MKDKTATTLKLLKKQKREEESKEPAAGSVIRFTSDEQFDYVAIFAGGMWYTSAQSYNNVINGRIAHKDMIKLLTNDRISDIKLATAWEKI